MKFQQSYRSWFLTLLIALHCFGFIKQIVSPNLLTLDSDDYINLAENLRDYQIPYSGKITKDHNLESLPNKGLYASRPILYSTFIWLGGGLKVGLWLTLLLQNFLSIFSVLIIEKLVRSKGFSINYLLASVGLLLFPSLWIYANWIMAETLFMFFLCWAIYYFAKNRPNYSLSALFLCLAFYTKPVLLFIVFIWFIGFIIKSFRTKKWNLIAIAFIPLLALIFQLIINLHYTKAPIISSMPAINLVQYNAYFTLSKSKGTTYADKWVDSIDNEAALISSKFGYYESYRYKKNEAIKAIKQNLDTYFWIHIQGSARWFIDPGRYDILNFFHLYFEDGNQGWTRTYYQQGLSGIWQRAQQENILLLLLILFIFIWNIVRLFLLLINAKHLVKSDMAMGLLFVSLAVYFAGVSGPVSTARFLLPMYPVILFWSSLRKSE